MWTIIVIIISNFICTWSSSFMRMSLADRPIFIGFVTGLLLGDMQTGILVGAQLELAFLGIVAIGAGTAADAATATIMTVVFSIVNHLPMETVIPLGITIGYAASILGNIPTVIVEFFVPSIDKALANDEENKFKMLCYSGTLLSNAVLKSIICIAGVLVGGTVLEEFVNNLPAFVLNGIGAAGAMLPALGISMILSLILNRQIAIYFMAGFVIYKYLSVDMIFMLVIGLLLAVVDFYHNSEGKGKSVSTTSVSEEEDFLS